MVHDSCKKAFVISHRLINNTFVIETFLNGWLNGPDWPHPILDLKTGPTLEDGNRNPSKFIKTYRQSLVAESSGLDELAGMGYRKAIEYLVKDWDIQYHPDKKDEIESSWLGKVVSQYYTGDLRYSGTSDLVRKRSSTP